MNFVKLISTSKSGANLLVKFLRMGRSDFRESKQASPHGFESNPVKDMIAVYSETSVMGDDVIIGYIPKESLTEIGESRVFSTDENGNLKVFIHLKANGNIHFGGTADNLIRYNQTAESINELKNDINELKQILSAWVPAPGDGGAALKTALLSYYSTALIQDISGAKIDEFKTL